MKFAIIVCAGLAGLYGLHRMLLWMERRGWIYYWHKRASSGTYSAAAGAFLQDLNSIYAPETRYTVQEMQSVRVKENSDGEPDNDPDTPSEK